jgi:hypothetical protein
MRAIVVYESIFGNTREVAEAVADGLRSRFHVMLTEVGAGLRCLAGVDLLVIGGPIHAWTMSRAITRKGARDQAKEADIEPVSADIGVREFLREIPAATGIAAATFDTALRKSGWLPTGSTAKPLAKRLERRGYRLLVPPEHFYVRDIRGPLDDGELERARSWGIGLADSFVRAGA